MRVLAAFAAACASLALVPLAHAVEYGVTEDEFKSSPKVLYPHLAELGMRRNVISVTWDPDHPTAMPPEAAQIDAMLPVASAHGIQVSFAIYLRRANALSGSPIATAQFATWVKNLARRFPAVKEFTGPNEPNLPRFWRPQFNPNCSTAPGAAYLPVMAAMYDALKSVDPKIRVIGLALSPRGNDQCKARSNASTSPMRFLRSLGDAYRASGRKAPIMDALSYHPYPPRDIDPPTKGYSWPNAGVPDLARLKQGIWDAFHGTAQPTTVEGLKLYLDEIGWQVDTNRAAGYWGAENVATISESAQASFYADLIRIVECDPAVAALNIFHLVDEPDRARLQTGLLRWGLSRRPAFSTVRGAIKRAACNGKPAAWQPVTGVVGPRADFGLVVGKNGKPAWGFLVGAAEGIEYSAALFKVASGGADHADLERALASGSAPTRVANLRGAIRTTRPTVVEIPSLKLDPGRYVYAVRLRAETNPERTFFAASPEITIG